MHPAASHSPDRQRFVRLGRAGGIYNKPIAIVPGTSKTFINRNSWGQPPAAPRSPSLLLIPIPPPSTSNCLRRRQRQEQSQEPQGYGTILSVRWLTNARGWCGGHGMRHALQAQHSSGSAAQRRPHPGLYRPKNTRTVMRNPL